MFLFPFQERYFYPITIRSFVVFADLDLKSNLFTETKAGKEQNNINSDFVMTCGYRRQHQFMICLREFRTRL